MLRLILILLLAAVPVSQHQSPPGNGKAGSGACRTCHADIYEKWSDSIHGKMIQPASTASVVSQPSGPREGDGGKYWRGGKFYVHENGAEREVLYTLGNRRIQHYLTSHPNGEITVLHSTWDIRRRQWFHSSDIVPGAPKNFVQQWNRSCLYCHVTQQVQDVKGFDPQTNTYKTAWIESSASCERCHGPMEEHARSGTISPKTRRTSFESLMTCGQCHWAKVVIDSGYTTSKPYFDHYSPSVMSWDATNNVDPDWWADGRAKRFSNEAKAFFLSGCFQSGEATCMSCHDSHWNRTDGNEELMKRPDQFCRNCHAGYEKEAHTHHSAGSSGSSCVNCHMPYSVSGVRDQMRDHSFLPPEPVNTVRFQIPNACSDCHKSETAEWAAEKMESWYPERKINPQRRGMAFTMAKKREPQAVPQLLRLAADSKENPLIRASAVGYLGLFPAKVPLDVLSRFVFDKDPMVRVEAARSLGLAGNESVVPTLLRATADQHRAVRVRAAASLVTLSFANKAPRLDPATLPVFAAALAEYRRSLSVEGDHPHIQVSLGELELYAGRIPAARQAFETALRLDPRFAPAFLGLAVVEVAGGNRPAAIRNATRAVELSGNEYFREFLKRLTAAN